MTFFAGARRHGAAAQAQTAPQHPVLTGQAAFTDAAHESPGTRRHLTVADLPEPAPEQSVDNGPNVVPRPANAWPIAPKGFKVELYTTGLDNPRLIRFAPNGDLFLAESVSGKIKVFRGVDASGQPQQTSVFAEGLHQPFGIAFYPNGKHPQWVYIGDTDAIVRFPYHNGDLTASGPMEHIADLPGGGRLRGGGHWTRDLAFSLDGSKLFASVGSHSNVDDSDTHPEEFHRADVLEFTPAGKFLEIYASGLRNCVGEAIHPTTGELWCSTNERDALGNNLVPDYITHVQEGGFYGWPWWYMGPTSRPAPRGQASRAQRQSHHARHSARAPLRLARDDFLSHHRHPQGGVLGYVQRAPVRTACPCTPSRPSIAATPSPPSTAPGTAPSAPVMRSSACPCTTATRPASTRIFLLASRWLRAMETSGADPWAWPWRPMDRSSSPTMAHGRSGT